MKQLQLITGCMGLICGILFTSLRQIPADGNIPLHTNTDSVALAGEWFLHPALPSDTAAGKLPVLRFQLRSKTFSGFTGCNQVSGSFVVLADQLLFDKNLTATKIVCEGYNEKGFLSNLLKVDHFRIKDSTLQLLIGQTPVSEWGRKPYTIKTL